MKDTRVSLVRTLEALQAAVKIVELLIAIWAVVRNFARVEEPDQ